MRVRMAWVVAAVTAVAGCARETTSGPGLESRLQAGRSQPIERGKARLKPGLRTSDDGASPEDASIPSEPTARPSAHVGGRVVDEAGNPFSDAEFLLPWSRHVGHCYGHDESGDWTSVMPDGRIDWRPSSWDPSPTSDALFHVVVRAVGFRTHFGPWRRIDADTDVGTIVLRRGERIDGVVLDDCGAVVADVRLDAAPDADEIDEEWTVDDRRSTARSDATGRFSIYGLAPGRYRVHCCLPDAPTATIVAGALDAVLVVPRAALPRRVAVNVVALGADGRPYRGIGSALLVLADEEQHRENLDADGRATIDSTIAGRVDLVVRDRDTDEKCIVRDVTTRDEPYVVQFGRTPTIRGRVVADVGARAVGERELRIAAEPDPPGSGERRSAPVGDDGTFVVAVPHDGRYLLVAYWTVGREPNVCRWASTGDDVEIRLPAPSSLEAIHLALHLPEGRVATDFCVRAVDSSGEYDVTDCEPRGPSIVDLPPGRTWRVTVRVKAGDDWFGPTTLDGVRSGGPPIDVALAPSPTIDGVVVRRDGTPVVRAKVRACSSAAPLVEGATTGLDGRFRLVGLAPGEWTLTAETDALATSPCLVATAGSHDVRVVATPRRAPY